MMDFIKNIKTLLSGNVTFDDFLRMQSKTVCWQMTKEFFKKISEWASGGVTFDDFLRMQPKAMFWQMVKECARFAVVAVPVELVFLALVLVLGKILSVILSVILSLVLLGFVLVMFKSESQQKNVPQFDCVKWQDLGNLVVLPVLRQRFPDISWDMSALEADISNPNYFGYVLPIGAVFDVTQADIAKRNLRQRIGKIYNISYNALENVVYVHTGRIFISDIWN